MEGRVYAWFCVVGKPYMCFIDRFGQRSFSMSGRQLGERQMHERPSSERKLTTTSAGTVPSSDLERQSAENRAEAAAEENRADLSARSATGFRSNTRPTRWSDALFRDNVGGPDSAGYAHPGYAYWRRSEENLEPCDDLHLQRDRATLEMERERDRAALDRERGYGGERERVSLGERERGRHDHRGGTEGVRQRSQLYDSGLIPESLPGELACRKLPGEELAAIPSRAPPVAGYETSAAALWQGRSEGILAASQLLVQQQQQQQFSVAPVAPAAPAIYIQQQVSADGVMPPPAPAPTDRRLLSRATRNDMIRRLRRAWRRTALAAPLNLFTILGVSAVVGFSYLHRCVSQRRSLRNRRSARVLLKQIMDEHL
ncbi:putative transmembrane protein [Gregarina niphandrodes]|uniref:Transmembrane protein n=1 Tax=Gregarina niphandrodes TaxID=110365 RepID=A0A023B1F3_GRENI|nr:putative transmembrane protein [Gregarina niphandrodes]EZG45890.1 putative transmembrane protein [Gregarina niphandrodes]|eukprot:XP_011132416.1 putative transmembrane protein [Gregarina niphandrodes]